jgi:hypothetical protein
MALSEREWRDVRGGEIAMVFQEPMTSPNPVMRIGALADFSPPSLNSPPTERFLPPSYLSCFFPLNFQLSTVNFLSPALESFH